MSSDNIFLCNSTEFVGNTNSVGIFDYLLSHLNNLDDLGIFEQISIIVPNQAVSAWLRDNIARHNHICANIDFVVLLGPVLQKIYLQNNPEHIFLDTSQIQFIIYEYLSINRLSDMDGGDNVNNYLYPDGQLNRSRAFLFAVQLSSIIQEYIYLRTDEIINLTKSNIPKWQQRVIKHILDLDAKTYIDVYRYFMNVDISTITVPKRMFIFGITSLYPSQLRIIKRLSIRTNIYWYYQSPSLNYYGDLLSPKARQKIEQKLLKYPDLTLDDLYLNEGNPILSTLGQQSREYIELLRSHEIEPFSIEPEYKESKPDSLLKIIQDDIKQINYRVDHNYRLLVNNEYYANPVKIQDTDSIKINSCHNKMREVQVMFNEVAKLLNDNQYTYQDILITAPNIEDYVELIEAVFDNEYLSDSSGNLYKLQYNITGNKRHKNFAIIKAIQLIFNLPYHLPISYLMDVLSQSVIQNALDINQNDINKIKRWIHDNNTHFGYDSDDYSEYGFENYTAHSLSSLLTRLVLGSLTSNDLDSNRLDTYLLDNQIYTPYHDLDFIDIKLINKLITIIELFKQVRDIVYIDNTTYQSHTLSEYRQLIQLIINTLNIDITLDYINLFIEELAKSKQDLIIDLLIINQLIDNYVKSGSSRFVFNGCITISSMHLTRAIPYKCVYILGLNFGEFPNYFEQSKLSILAKDWYLADRNYYIEDKQIFLDTILAAQDKLYLSYVGRDEQSNYEIYPSPVLSLLIDTITNSVTNFWYDENDYSQGVDLTALVSQHSLHPFSNRVQINYSKYWQNISHKTSDDYADLRWDFNRTSPFELTSDELSKYCEIRLEQLVKTFEYTNNNLFKVLGYSIFDNEPTLTDELSLVYLDKPLINAIYQYITKYPHSSPNELTSYLEQLGVIGYQDIGISQYTEIYTKYIQYKACSSDLSVMPFVFKHTPKLKKDIKYKFVISGEIMLNQQQQIVVPLDFVDYCLKDVDIDNTNKIYHEKIKYKYKIKILVLLYILKTVTISTPLDGLDNIDTSRIVYRDITLDGSIVDKVFVLDGNTGIDKLLAYYLRSLQNPLLIVPSVLNKAGLDKYTRPINKPLEEQLADAFYNSNIKSDIIFDQIIDNYFQYTQNAKIPNDILNIYNYLAELRIE